VLAVVSQKMEVMALPGWTIHGNDPVEGETVTPKNTGNRLIDVEEIASVGTLSCSIYI
jgi:hypothetical protein